MFTLLVSMNSDDDCAIEYQGGRYCYYSDDLEISLTLDTREECVEHLKTIKVLDGYKCSEKTKEFIEAFIRDEGTEYIAKDFHHSYMSGNQEYDIMIKYVEKKDINNQYIGSKIVNIKKVGSFIYCDLVTADGIMLKSGILEGVVSKLKENLLL